MAAAGLGLRKSGKSRAKSSTQGWSPNSGQAAEDESGSFVDVLVSEQGQQSSSSGLTLPQQQNQQAGSQTQSSSSMDQLQNGLVQYQPSGSNPEPPTANALGQYQPAGNNETPLARDDLNSDVIVNAQLTHLINRDDATQGQDAPHVSDVPMPDVPTVQDIATPRRIIGEDDAANGASVHNQPQVNASGLPVTCVEYDSHMVKRVYNNGATVKPITTTYMHIVSMEGSVMIMNCSQSKPQIRMQLMQSPANEKPSPEQQRIQKFYSLLLRDPDQASTAAPPDDERDLFGREEALRMDEEITDFQWFEHVTWDSIKDLRGTTYVQPPTRFRFALEQAQHAILRAIVHNNPTSPASESAWKALVLSSWLLLGRPAVNASESNCAHFLDSRLELFWAEDWSALWAMVRAECDVAPVRNTTRRTDKQQMQSRIKKMHMIALLSFKVF